jgi:hypothetical protein
MKSLKEMMKQNRDIGLADDPQFDKAPRFDWRRYVPEDIKLAWKDICYESRVMVKVFAEEVANRAMSQSND